MGFEEGVRHLWLLGWRRVLLTNLGASFCRGDLERFEDRLEPFAARLAVLRTR
jgi:hypothetical protein